MADQVSTLWRRIRQLPACLNDSELGEPARMSGTKAGKELNELVKRFEVLGGEN